MAAAPALADAPVAPTVIEVGTSVVVGQTVKFTFTESDGSKPTLYQWMTNSGEVVGRATAGNGKATVKVPASQTFNRLTVYAVGADGSVGPATTVDFTATLPDAYADQDLSGDGKPDLVATVGGNLLEASGKGTAGKVRPAVNLTPDGNGVGGTLDGYQVITGKFSGGPFESYLAYNPTNGVALEYSGHGSDDLAFPRLVTNNEVSVGGYFADWDGNNPIQLAAAYDASDLGHQMPDLVGVLGSADTGYHLQYYIPFDFAPGLYQSPVDTGATTPTGGSDWENWRLSSKLLPSGAAISLWNPSTGALYLWEGVTFDSTTGLLSYTQYQVSAKFLTGAADTTLRLTDIDADGVPDVWAITGAGTVTAYRVSGLSTTGTAKIKAKGAPFSLS